MPQEIRPQKLRALLLLLVVVPLIPMGLMLRFVMEIATNEREAALERVSAAYQRTLVSAGQSVARQFADRPRAEITPRQVHAAFRALLDREILVRVADPGGEALTGFLVPPVEPVARTSLRNMGIPWEVQIFLGDPATLEGQVRERTQAYIAILAVTLACVLAISFLAAFTVSNQIELRELRNSATALVTHEMRTPLSGLRVLLETMRGGRCKNAQQQQEYLDLMAEEADRLTRLTDNFLSLARFEKRRRSALHLTVFPAADVAAEAADKLQSRLQAPGVKFQLEVAPDLPEMVADHEGLVTVLTNLLDNALKYSGATKLITLRAFTQRRFVFFEVEDDGEGIARDEIRRIFHPFYQADARLSRTREGCGLGLALVACIVAAHRGKIEVQSKPGAGARFTVRIPVR